MNANFVSRSIALCVVGAWLVAGCGGKKGGDVVMKDSSAPAKTVAPVKDSAAEASDVITYVFHAVPTAIDSVSGTITVRHEKIMGYAEAGTDSYNVADPTIFHQLTLGKETHVTLRVAGLQALVVKVKEGHEPGQEHHETEKK